MPDWCAIALAVWVVVTIVLYEILSRVCERSPEEEYPGQYGYVEKEADRGSTETVVNQD